LPDAGATKVIARLAELKAARVVPVIVNVIGVTGAYVIAASTRPFVALISVPTHDPDAFGPHRFPVVLSSQ